MYLDRRLKKLGLPRRDLWCLGDEVANWASTELVFCWIFEFIMCIFILGTGCKEDGRTQQWSQRTSENHCNARSTTSGVFSIHPQCCRRKCFQSASMNLEKVRHFTRFHLNTCTIKFVYHQSHHTSTLIQFLKCKGLYFPTLNTSIQKPRQHYLKIRNKVIFSER